MFTRNRAISLALFLVLSSFSQSSLSAEEFRRMPALSNNMSFHDVLKTWGAPKEKEEQEAKRQDVWVYPGARVIFQDGRVAAWFQDGIVGVEPEAPKKEVLAAKEPSDNEDTAVEDILRDILKEPPLPSESKVPVSPSAASTGQSPRDAKIKGQP